MATKDLGKIHSCDHCGHQSEPQHNKDGFITVSVNAGKNGHYFEKNFDVCEKCFPSSLLKPEQKKSDEILPENKPFLFSLIQLFKFKAEKKELKLKKYDF